MEYHLWSDERGGVITTELVLVSSLVVATVLTGLTALRDGLVGEFSAMQDTLEKHSIRNVSDFQSRSTIKREEHSSDFVAIYHPELSSLPTDE